MIFEFVLRKNVDPKSDKKKSRKSTNKKILALPETGALATRHNKTIPSRDNSYCIMLITRRYFLPYPFRMAMAFRWPA